MQWKPQVHTKCRYLPNRIHDVTDHEAVIYTLCAFIQSDFMKEMGTLSKIVLMKA